MQIIPFVEMYSIVLYSRVIPNMITQSDKVELSLKERKGEKNRIESSREKVNNVMYVYPIFLACNFLPRGNN